MFGVFENAINVPVVKAKVCGSAVVDGERVEQRIWVVGCRLHLGRIGYGKEVGAHGDVGARVEELFCLEVESSCISVLTWRSPTETEMRRWRSQRIQKIASSLEFGCLASSIVWLLSPMLLAIC